MNWNEIDNIIIIDIRKSCSNRVAKFLIYAVKRYCVKII